MTDCFFHREVGQETGKGASFEALINAGHLI